MSVETVGIYRSRFSKSHSATCTQRESRAVKNCIAFQYGWDMGSTARRFSQSSLNIDSKKPQDKRIVATFSPLIPDFTMSYVGPTPAQPTNGRRFHGHFATRALKPCPLYVSEHDKSAETWPGGGSSRSALFACLVYIERGIAGRDWGGCRDDGQGGYGDVVTLGYVDDGHRYRLLNDTDFRTLERVPPLGSTRRRPLKLSVVHGRAMSR